MSDLVLEMSPTQARACTDPVAEERLKMQIPGPHLLRVDPLCLGLALGEILWKRWLARRGGVFRDILGLLLVHFLRLRNPRE